MRSLVSLGQHLATLSSRLSRGQNFPVNPPPPPPPLKYPLLLINFLCGRFKNLFSHFNLHLFISVDFECLLCFTPLAWSFDSFKDSVATPIHCKRSSTLLTWTRRKLIRNSWPVSTISSRYGSTVAWGACATSSFDNDWTSETNQKLTCTNNTANSLLQTTIS